jgi:hypothetical protein
VTCRGEIITITETAITTIKETTIIDLTIMGMAIKETTIITAIKETTIIIDLIITIIKITSKKSTDKIFPINHFAIII